MKKTYTLLIATLMSIACSAQWIPITTDATGDGTNSSLLDGTSFEYMVDQNADSIFFRIGVNDWGSNTMAFGVNIMITFPNGGPSFKFWGANNVDEFQRLLTCWVTGTPPSGYTGTIGVSDSAGIAVGNYSNLSSNNLEIFADISGKTITIGLKRTDLIPNNEFNGNSAVVKVAAAVGSNVSWNDDIYDPFGSITINRLPSGIEIEEQDFKVRFAFDGLNKTINLLSNTPMSNLELYSMDGQLAYQTKISDRSYQVRYHNLSSGVYLLRIVSEFNEVKLRKIALQ